MSIFARPLLIAVALYAALLADVALRACLSTAWCPSFLLLTAFVAARSGGVGWAAIAGLMCDGIEGRPLGVTMLVATLAATIAREITSADAAKRIWTMARAFAFISFVEAASRILANTVATDPSAAQPPIEAFQVAVATSLIAAAVVVTAQIAARLITRGSRSRPSSLNVDLFR